jgi:hypothetical protein
MVKIFVRILTIKKTNTKQIRIQDKKRFAMSFPYSVLLAFSQSYVGHDLRKNKIVVPFFC